MARGTGTPRSSGARTWLLRLFALTVPPLLLLEAGLWLVAPVSSHPVSRRLVTQNIAGTKSELVLEHNTFGMRTLSLTQREKPPNTMRIFTLGASTTEQLMQETADTWTGVLEQLLEERFADSGLRFEVATYAFGGMTSRRNLRWVHSEMLDFEPDILVTLLGINDIANNGGEGYRWDGVDAFLERSAQQTSSGNPLEATCLRLSQTCRRLRTAARSLQAYWLLARGEAEEWHSANLTRLQEEYRATPEVDQPRRPVDPREEFEDVVREIVRTSEEAGVDAVVLSQPTIWKADMPPEELESLWFLVASHDGRVRAPVQWMMREMTAYNEAQRRIALAGGADFVDLDAGVPKNLAHFFDDCHFTDLGNRVVAEVALPAVARLVEERRPMSP